MYAAVFQRIADEEAEFAGDDATPLPLFGL